MITLWRTTISKTYQRLGFGWKRLDDDNTLEDYNIQDFSEIDLNQQLSFKVTAKESNKEVEWEEIAVVALESFEKELEEKRIQFSKLTQHKDNVENEMKKDEKYLDCDLKKQFNIERDITACKVDVEKKKGEIKELEEIINKKMKETAKLDESINLKRYRKESKKKEISDLNNSIGKLTNEFKNTSSKNAENEKLTNEFKNTSSKN